METLKGYTYAKEDIKKGDLVAILEKQNAGHKSYYVIENVDDRLFTKEAIAEQCQEGKLKAWKEEQANCADCKKENKEYNVRYCSKHYDSIGQHLDNLKANK